MHEQTPVLGVSAAKQLERGAVGRSYLRRVATGKLRRRLYWLLPVVVVAVLAWRQRQALAAATIEWSGFSKADSIYFAPTIGEQQKATFRATLAAARVRVAELYAPLRDAPIIIVADAQTLSRFTDGSIAVTHYQPHRAVIILGPAGQSVDVVAHELAHAELYARVGYTKMEWCVPTWFDEGLAVQFDNRPFYSQQEFERHVKEGWQVPSFHQLRSRAGFFTGTREQVRFHYAAARYAVGDWLRRTGRAQATRLLDANPCSGQLYETLASISSSLERRAPGRPARGPAGPSVGSQMWRERLNH